MLLIDKETKTGLIAKVWQIKEIRVVNAISTIFLYGFWDTVHLNKYNDGMAQPADIIPVQIQRDDDPFSLTDESFVNDLNQWLSEGRNLREIYKHLYERFIMNVEPFNSDWGSAIQEWE